MGSWIYIFSKFTPEALLFEALLIFLLTASYAAFWVLRKRRLGAAEEAVPASVVKAYLNELIGEAHDMRTQLFGLLSGGVPMPSGEAPAPGATILASGDAGKNLSILERKMSEQAAAIQKIMEEKATLEKELTEARAKGAAAASGAPPAAGVGSEDVQKLQEKCSNLEARLAEYSVIEDDLANLKRLQQENAQLKTQLAKGGAAITDAPQVKDPAAAAAAAPQLGAEEASASAQASPTAPAPAEASPAAATGTDASTENAAAASAESAPASDAAPDVAAAGASLDAAAALNGGTAGASAPADAGAPEAPAAAGADEKPAASAENPAAAFEGLVDEVEKSLQPDSKAQTDSKAEAPAAPEAAAKAPAKTPSAEKSDDDLIAEFEKMLNS
jgi:hypothetical protein